MMVAPFFLLFKMRRTNNISMTEENSEADNTKNLTFWDKIWRNYTSGFRQHDAAKLFYSFFLCRQFFYGMIFVVVAGKESQLTLFIITTFGYLAYLVAVRPFEYSVQNIVAIGNEFVVLV